MRPQPQGGGALVSGVLVPMDASKMLFLAKITFKKMAFLKNGNFFTFSLSRAKAVFHFFSSNRLSKKAFYT